MQKTEGTKVKFWLLFLSHWNANKTMQNPTLSCSADSSRVNSPPPKTQFKLLFPLKGGGWVAQLQFDQTLMEPQTWTLAGMVPEERRPRRVSQKMRQRASGGWWEALHSQSLKAGAPLSDAQCCRTDGWGAESTHIRSPRWEWGQPGESPAPLEE